VQLARAIRRSVAKSTSICGATVKMP